jgi:hypothetical protein
VASGGGGGGAGHTDENGEIRKKLPIREILKLWLNSFGCGLTGPGRKKCFWGIRFSAFLCVKFGLTTVRTGCNVLTKSLSSHHEIRPNWFHDSP